MKMFSDCSGPCETCANNKPGVNCLAGHGDDHYVENEMPNTRNRANLKAQLDLLADGHQDIADLTSKINALLVDADEAEKDQGCKRTFCLKAADRRIVELLALLEAQADRALRVRAEAEEIRKNLRTI